MVIVENDTIFNKYTLRHTQVCVDSINNKLTKAKEIAVIIAVVCAQHKFSVSA